MVRDDPRGHLRLPQAPEGGSAFVAPYRRQPFKQRDCLGTDDKRGDISFQFPRRHRTVFRLKALQESQKLIDLFVRMAHAAKV